MITKSSMPELVSADDLSGLLDLDSRSVRLLAGRHPNIRAGRGRYRLKDAISARLAETSRSQVGDAVDRENAALIAARRATAELNLAARRRELVPLTEALNAVDNIIGTLRHALDSVPARLSKDPETRSAARDLIDEALQLAADKIGGLKMGTPYE